MFQLSKCSLDAISLLTLSHPGLLAGSDSRIRVWDISNGFRKVLQIDDIKLSFSMGVSPMAISYDTGTLFHMSKNMIKVQFNPCS